MPIIRKPRHPDIISRYLNFQTLIYLVSCMENSLNRTHRPGSKVSALMMFHCIYLCWSGVRSLPIISFTNPYAHKVIHPVKQTPTLSDYFISLSSFRHTHVLDTSYPCSSSHFRKLPDLTIKDNSFNYIFLQKYALYASAHNNDK